MKKILILGLLFLGIQGYAQDESRVESMRKDFITNELQLTPAEADAFFPIYNEYTQKRKGALKSLRSERKDADASVDKIIDMEQGMIDLRREYMEKFKKVLPEKKVVQLIEAEKKFKTMMVKQLRK